MRVIFVRKVIHLTTNFIGSNVVNHVLAELFVSCESVVDTKEVLLFALLLERIGDVNILCPLASSRNGAHGVALSLCSSLE